MTTPIGSDDLVPTAVAGAGGAISGVMQAYIGEPTTITKALGIASPTVISLWLLVTGVLLVRKGRATDLEPVPV